MGIVHLVGINALAMNISIPVSEWWLEIQDRNMPPISGNPVDLHRNAEKIGRITEVEAEADHHQVEFFSGKRQVISGSLLHFHAGEAPPSVVHGRAGWFNPEAF